MKTKQRWFLTSVSLLTICFVLIASSPLVLADNILPDRYFRFNSELTAPSSELLTELNDGEFWFGYTLEGDRFLGRIRARSVIELPSTTDVSGILFEFWDGTDWVDGFGIISGAVIGGSSTLWYESSFMHWDLPALDNPAYNLLFVDWLFDNGIFTSRPLIIPTPDINFDNIFDDGMLGGAYAYYSSLLGDFIKEQPLLVTYFVLLCGMILLSFVVFGKR